MDCFYIFTIGWGEGFGIIFEEGFVLAAESGFSTFNPFAFSSDFAITVNLVFPFDEGFI